MLMASEKIDGWQSEVGDGGKITLSLLLVCWMKNSKVSNIQRLVGQYLSCDQIRFGTPVVHKVSLNKITNSPANDTRKGPFDMDL